MTKQDFITYLQHPENLNAKSIGDLEKLVQDYPYFQIGRMLYLKNLHNENSINYEKNLHITSAYAPNGKVLYNLIKKRTVKKEIAQVVKEVETKKEIKNVEVKITKEILPKLEPVVVLQEMPMRITADAKKENKKDQTDEFDELQVLEKQMLREAYRTSMRVELLQEQEEKSLKLKKKSPISKTASHSFGDWMKLLGGETPDAVKEEIAQEKKAKYDIIDNFILEETAKSIPKPKATFYSADSMAKKSLQDDETFVSETLASIYLKQGNLPKALRSYEILLVKYPEKIHIFAPLLEKIKKLLKDQNSK